MVALRVVAASSVEVVVLFGMGSFGEEGSLAEELASHETDSVGRSMFAELAWTTSRRLGAVLGGLDVGFGPLIRESRAPISFGM